ncbi:hypothetical protein RYX36_021261 [Vicia faba]
MTKLHKVYRYCIGPRWKILVSDCLSLPIPVGGYSHEITYNKICSVESTMMRHHQENKFEFTSLKRMMRTLLKQTQKKEVQEENQESGEEEKDDVEDEESGEGEKDEAEDMSGSG